MAEAARRFRFAAFVYLCTSARDAWPAIADLMLAAADIGEAPGAPLAQAMGGEVGTLRFVGPFSKLVSEARRGERLTERCNQERLDADGRRGVDDLAQLWMHRDFEVGRFLSLGFALVDREDFFVDVVWSNFHDI